MGAIFGSSWSNTRSTILFLGVSAVALVIHAARIQLLTHIVEGHYLTEIDVSIRLYVRKINTTNRRMIKVRQSTRWIVPPCTRRCQHISQWYVVVMDRGVSSNEHSHQLTDNQARAAIHAPTSKQWFSAEHYQFAGSTDNSDPSTLTVFTLPVA